MSKGTILYVGGFEMPDKNAAAHRVLNNGKALRELGYQVVFLGISHSDATVTKRVYDGFDCWFMPYPNNFKTWFRHLADIHQVENLLQMYSNVQGIIFYNYQSIALWKGIRLCKKMRIFSVADVTEWYCASKKNPIFYCIKQVDTSLRMRFLQPKMDGVIVISSYLNDYYVKKGCKVVQIPPLIDKAEEKWEIEKTQRSGTKKQLVYAGSPGDMKDNLLLVIKEVANFEDEIELHVVGATTIPQDGVQESKNVIFHGRIPHTECIRLITNSDFQIFLRQDNLVTRAGFPTKLGESFACGTPIITNAHSNVKDYLTEGVNSLVVSDMTQEGISEIVKSVSKLEVIAIEKMKEACKNNQSFDYRQYIQKIEDFLESL